jgi:hypothetical protein
VSQLPAKALHWRHCPKQCGVPKKRRRKIYWRWLRFLHHRRAQSDKQGFGFSVKAHEFRLCLGSGKFFDRFAVCIQSVVQIKLSSIGPEMPSDNGQLVELNVIVQPLIQIGEDVVEYMPEGQNSWARISSTTFRGKSPDLSARIGLSFENSHTEPGRAHPRGAAQAANARADDHRVAHMRLFRAHKELLTPNG